MSLPDASAQDARIVSISVVGNMNPAIHHPAWYRLHGILPDADFDFALRAGAVCSPDTARFFTSTYEISCEATRWGIASEEPSRQSELAEIADRVFGLLQQTPVETVELLVAYHLKLEVTAGLHLP